MEVTAPSSAAANRDSAQQHGSNTAPTEILRKNIPENSHSVLWADCQLHSHSRTQNPIHEKSLLIIVNAIPIKEYFVNIFSINHTIKFDLLVICQTMYDFCALSCIL